MQLRIVFFYFCSLLALNGYAGSKNTYDNHQQTYQAKTVISYHTVSAGEDISFIAKMNDVSEENIRLWNNVDSDIITPGTQLRIQTIEFVPVEKADLIKPELEVIYIDRNRTIDAMADYINKLDTDTQTSSN